MIINALRDLFDWLWTILVEGAYELERFGYQESRSLLRAAIYAGGFPVLGLLFGAIAGAWSPHAKVLFVGAGTLVAIVTAVVVTVRHALVLALAGAAISAYQEVQQREGVLARVNAVLSAPVNGAVGVTNAVLAIAYTEVVIGLAMIALPVHENPGATMVLSLAALGLAALGAQHIGENARFWRGFAKVFLVATALCALALILFPSLGGLANTKREELDRSIRGAQRHAQREAVRAEVAALPRTPHPGRKVKRGERLYLSGGSSQVLCFDPPGAVFLDGSKGVMEKSSPIVRGDNGVFSLVSTDLKVGLWKYRVDTSRTVAERGGRPYVDDTAPFCFRAIPDADAYLWVSAR